MAAPGERKLRPVVEEHPAGSGAYRPAQRVADEDLDHRAPHYAFEMVVAHHEQLAAVQTGLATSALLWADAAYATSEDVQVNPYQILWLCRV